MESKECEEIFEEIVKDFISDKMKENVAPTVITHWENILRYTVPHGFEGRGFLLVKAYEEVCSETPTPENLHLVCKLGWCLQILQTYLIMMDEVFDDDRSRYGKPTWYHHRNREIHTVNDAILMQITAYDLLRKYFGTMSSVYTELFEYFNTAVKDFFFSQSWEERSFIKNDPDMVAYEVDSFKRNILPCNLTPFLAAPFKLAMIYAGYSKTSECWKKVEKICADINLYVRMKDDFNDSFGENLNDTLDDRDIKSGACKWLIIKAKELSSPMQLDILKKSYGKDDDDSVKRVKEIYRELKIPEFCKTELEMLNEKIQNDLIAMIDKGHTIGIVVRQCMNWNKNSRDF